MGASDVSGAVEGPWGPDRCRHELLDLSFVGDGLTWIRAKKSVLSTRGWE
jgi:hypothetical protein